MDYVQHLSTDLLHEMAGSHFAIECCKQQIIPGQARQVRNKSKFSKQPLSADTNSGIQSLQNNMN